MDSSKKNALFLYFIEICSLSLFLFFSLSLEFLPPSVRVPDINDKSISFPYTEYEIISASMLPIFNIIIPSVVILAVGLINRFKNKRIFVALLGLYFTVGLAFLFTNLFKSPVGRLRPDFLSRCRLDNNNNCQGDKHLVAEGRRSFPSGHSSSSFGGLGFTSLFLSDLFSIFDGSGRIYKFIIFLIPLLTASLVSISRIIDYRHHYNDVFAGFLIGCVSALTGYFYFYPSLCRSDNGQLIEISENSTESNTACLENV